MLLSKSKIEDWGDFWPVLLQELSGELKGGSEDLNELYPEEMPGLEALLQGEINGYKFDIFYEVGTVPDLFVNVKTNSSNVGLCINSLSKILEAKQRLNRDKDQKHFTEMSNIILEYKKHFLDDILEF